MKTPVVSIVVATYGRFNCFKKLVDSIRIAFQKEESYEIIAVSSDPADSEKMAWMTAQPDVRVIPAGTRAPGEPRKHSLYYFENIGIKESKGDWIFVTNDDTVVDVWFYNILVPIADKWDVIMVKGHVGDLSLGCRTAVIGTITPPNGPTRDLYLYDFTIIRKSVYERVGWLDEKLDWYGKGFDLAMACETLPGIRVCYGTDLMVNHAITHENRNPPHYTKDFRCAFDKWKEWCKKSGWSFTWPW